MDELSERMEMSPASKDLGKLTKGSPSLSRSTSLPLSRFYRHFDAWYDFLIQSTDKWSDSVLDHIVAYCGSLMRGVSNRFHQKRGVLAWGDLRKNNPGGRAGD